MEEQLGSVGGKMGLPEMCMTTRALRAALGVRAPMPTGWLAAGDGGPCGRPRLRADLAPGAEHQHQLGRDTSTKRSVRQLLLRPPLRLRHLASPCNPSPSPRAPACLRIPAPSSLACVPLLDRRCRPFAAAAAAPRTHTR